MLSPYSSIWRWTVRRRHDPGLRARIEALYLASDQRRLYVACPACAARSVPTLVQLVEQEPGVVWQCPACRHGVDEAGRLALVATGEWRPSAASPVRGYHVWAFYSPWVSMAEILKKRAEAATSPELAQTFHNLVLGEPWSPPAMTIEVSDLLAQREEFGDRVPAGVRFLTLGVDCQDDQLMGLIVGWGLLEEAWAHRRRHLHGRSGRRHAVGRIGRAARDAVPGRRRGRAPDHRDARGQWRAFHRPHLPHDGAAAECRALMLRLQGVRRHAPRRGALENREGHRPALHDRRGRDQGALYARLKRVKGTARIHIPTSFDDALCRELTAESLVLERNKWGRIRPMWKLPRGRANEMLHCLTYAMRR